MILNAKNLFITGVVVHLLYVAIVFNTPGNIYYGLFGKDNGKIENTISSYSVDSKDYMDDANNCLSYGTFGKENTPDYHRIIGYPIIIFITKFLFGAYWFPVLILMQAIIGALIYPILFLIGKILIGRTNYFIVGLGVFYLVLSGTYFARVPLVLSDLPFSFFFFAGLYYSLLSVTKRSWFYCAISILFISYAALIRPSLILYSVVNFILLLSVARKAGTWQFFRTKWIVITSSVIMIISCNFSSLRLYSNYGTLMSTDILGINMFEYSAKGILEANSRSGEYKTYAATIDQQSDFIQKDALRKKIFFQSIGEYPVSSMKYWNEAMVNHMLTPHWMTVGSMFGVYKRSVPELNLKRSLLMAFIFYFFSALTLVLIIIPFSAGLLSLLKRREYLYVASIILFCFLFMAPTFIANTSERLRMPVEPIIVFFAFQQIAIWIESLYSVKFKRNYALFKNVKENKVM